MTKTGPNSFPSVKGIERDTTGIWGTVKDDIHTGFSDVIWFLSGEPKLWHSTIFMFMFSTPTRILSIPPRYPYTYFVVDIYDVTVLEFSLVSPTCYRYVGTQPVTQEEGLPLMSWSSSISYLQKEHEWRVVIWGTFPLVMRLMWIKTNETSEYIYLVCDTWEETDRKYRLNNST